MGRLLLLEDHVCAEQEDGVGQTAPSVVDAPNYLVCREGGKLLIDGLDEAYDAGHIHGTKVVTDRAVLDIIVKAEVSERTTKSLYIQML